MARQPLPCALSRGGAGAAAVPQGRCCQSRGADRPWVAFAVRQPLPEQPLPAQPGCSHGPRASPVRAAGPRRSPRTDWLLPARNSALRTRTARLGRPRRLPRTSAPAAGGGTRSPTTTELRTESKPGGPRCLPRGHALPGPCLGPASRSRQRQQAGRAGEATYRPQPAAPPWAQPRRSPRHLHGDIRSTAGTAAGMVRSARRLRALAVPGSRGPGIDGSLPPAASRLRPRPGSARV